jgi:hypothetical protein
MGLGLTQPLTELLPGIFLGVKGGWLVGFTNLPPSVSRLSRQSVGASTSHNPLGFTSCFRDGFLFFFVEFVQKFPKKDIDDGGLQYLYCHVYGAMRDS